MIKSLALLAILISGPAVAQTTLTAPQILGCSSPAPAVPPATTIFIASCKTPVFVPLTSTSVIASISKTAPSWSHSYSGYTSLAPTALLVACPTAATVSADGSKCTNSTGADASSLVAANAVSTFTIAQVPALTTASLSWKVPTLNTDGSALTDLATFNVWQGATPDSLVALGSVSVATTSYKLNSLTVGSSYSFAVSTVNALGAESDKTVLTKTIVLPKTPGAPTNITIAIP